MPPHSSQSRASVPRGRGPGALPPGLSGPSFAGAFDLSTLARTPEPATQAEPATPQAPAPGSTAPETGPATDAVFDVTDDTFMTDVLERSQAVPVVIDFWATWCGPCKQLSPVLEKLAAEAGGTWLLAKMDVDANPGVSGQLQIQSIPTVMVALGGRLMQGFSGALPEPQVREFLAAVLQAASQSGIGEGPPPPPVDPRMATGEEALQRGDVAAARAAFTEILRDAPGDAQARSGLALVALLERIGGLDPARALADAAARPDDLQAQLIAADIQVAQGLTAEGLATIVATVRRTFGEDRELLRARFVELAELLPPDDPVLVKARRDLTNALF